MPDQSTHTDYPELISRYLSGNATAAEVQQLEDWVLADAEHKRQFMAFKKAWLLSGMQQAPPAVEVDQKWEETAALLFKETRVVPMKPAGNRRRWLAVAASVAVLIVASLWVYQNYFGDRPMSVTTADATEAFQLPDGSQITLNRFSTLQYEPGDTIRSVSLTGGAYFEVASEPDRPFLIQTPNVQIEVLGTSFYVDAREDQPEVQVMVAEGAVAVRSDTQNVTLRTDEKAVFQKEDQSLAKDDNDDPNFQTLKTGRLVFDSSSLDYVAFTLERQYNRVVEINVENLEACALTGNYNNQSLNVVLDLIENALNIDIESEDNRIIFSGNCQ